MKDFDSWFLQQGQEVAVIEDEFIYLQCSGCGKTEIVMKRAMLNGDAWAMDFGDGTGLCGGSDRCVP